MDEHFKNMSDDEWEEVCNPNAAEYRKKEAERLDRRRNRAGKECLTLEDLGATEFEISQAAVRRGEAMMDAKFDGD